MAQEQKTTLIHVKNTTFILPLVLSTHIEAFHKGHYAYSNY